MKLSYFNEETYDELKNTIAQNIEKYLSGDDWLEEFFSGRQYKSESTVDVEAPNLYDEGQVRVSPTEKTQEDIANVKIIYGNMINLSPLQATNPYLWACMTHTAYREYVLHRWFDGDRFDALSDEKKIRRIQLRFFATSNERSLNDNAIARLWWYGRLSYDETNRQSNPFHLTEVLVGNTKFCTDFMLSHCCWNRTIGKGVLRAVKDFKSNLGPNEGISNYYRFGLKPYLNRYAAVTSLDFLTEEDIYELSLEHLNSVRRSRKVVGTVEDDVSEDDE
jgi:hypothetical protein